MQKVTLKGSMPLQHAKCQTSQYSLSISYKLFSDKSSMNETKKADRFHIPYASAIGSLMFVMLCNRLDIA